jgi:hypothetical protein
MTPHLGLTLGFGKTLRQYIRIRINTCRKAGLQFMVGCRDHGVVRSTNRLSPQENFNETNCADAAQTAGNGRWFTSRRLNSDTSVARRFIDN